jgi:four helix bundle protein
VTRGEEADEADEADETGESHSPPEPPMSVAHYQQLIVWQKAMDWAVEVYRATETFPKHETYRLCDQLRRCAISVPSNIAEGQGRNSTREFLKHLGYSNGSLYEAETQVILAFRLGYFSDEVRKRLLDMAGEIGRILNGLTAALERRLAADEG